MLPHSLCDAIEAIPYSNQTLGMAIAHVATTSWCCDIILVATRVMRSNTLSCNTHSSLVAPFATTWTSCHCKVQQRLRRCISCCCHTYNRSKSLCCNAYVLQIQNAFCNAKQKSIVQSFTHASACNASQRKKLAICDIATISGLLQLGQNLVVERER